MQLDLDRWRIARCARKEGSSRRAMDRRARAPAYVFLRCVCMSVAPCMQQLISSHPPTPHAGAVRFDVGGRHAAASRLTLVAACHLDPREAEGWNDRRIERLVVELCGGECWLTPRASTPPGRGPAAHHPFIYAHCAVSRQTPRPARGLRPRPRQRNRDCGSVSVPLCAAVRGNQLSLSLSASAPDGRLVRRHRIDIATGDRAARRRFGRWISPPPLLRAYLLHAWRLRPVLRSPHSLSTSARQRKKKEKNNRKRAVLDPPQSRAEQR